MQIALVASLIFRLADGAVTPAADGGAHTEQNGVACVLRIGGLMALVSGE